MNKHVLKNIFLIWLYISVLIFSVLRLSEKWSYQGINYFEQSTYTYFFIYFFSTIPVFFLKKKLILPSDYVGFYLYIFTFIPAVVIPFFITNPSNFNDSYIFFLIVFLICIIYLLKNQKQIKPKVFNLKPVNTKLLPILTFIIYAFSIVTFVSIFGLKFELPDFNDIYDVRADYKEITKGNLFARYLVGWMGYIVNILFLLYGLYKKNYKIIIIAIIFQLYIFTLMALKSHLAAFILAVALFYYFKKYKSISTQQILLFLTGMMVFFSVLGFYLNNDFFEMLITRRIMIVPSQATYYHFDFFDSNPKTFWGHSILKNLVEYPYALNPPNLMGQLHFNRPEMTVVVNFFMEGFTAFGYLGVIISTIILKVVLNAIDNIFTYRSNSNYIIIILILVLSNVLNSSSIFTLLLTHGWLVLILILSTFPWKLNSTNNNLN